VVELVTLNEVKGVLGIPLTETGGDTRLVSLIGTATELIESYLRRKLELKERVERVRQSGTVLRLHAFPVNEIISIQIGGTDSEVTDYNYDKDTGLVYRNLGKWPYAPQGYDVKYVGGLERIPGPIKQACLFLVQQLDSATENSGDIIQSERIGDASVTYLSTGARGAANNPMSGFSPAITALLNPYKGRYL